MIKNFTKTAVACMAMLFCLGGEINAQNNLCLRDIDSDLEGDYTYYGYNKNNKLDSVYQYKYFYDVESYRLYKYDEKGNMISEEGYGILPMNDNNYKDFSLVFKVNYTFDAMNRLATRVNYNLDEFATDNSFILGGVYSYIYDSKGKLKERKLYWDEGMTDLYEKVDYMYNEEERLERETYTTYFLSGESQDMVVYYYYDEQGRNTKISTMTMNPDTGEMRETATCYYEFDANGNLASRTSYDNLSVDIPNEKHILIYADTLASDVAFPINYEDDMDFFVKSKNVAVQDSIYKRDAEGESFMLFDIENWNYEEIDGSTGIDNVMKPEQNVYFRRDADGNILIGGMDNSECIRIYDAEGRMVRSEMYGGKVNTENLPRGMYILMTRQGTMKFSR